MVESGRFHVFEVKLKLKLNAKYGFHAWNLADFMEFSGFHGFHVWNPPDFMADLEKCKLENVEFL